MRAPQGFPDLIFYQWQFTVFEHACAVAASASETHKDAASHCNPTGRANRLVMRQHGRRRRVHAHSRSRIKGPRAGKPDPSWSENGAVRHGQDAQDVVPADLMDQRNAVFIGPISALSFLNMRKIMADRQFAPTLKKHSSAKEMAVRERRQEEKPQSYQ